LFISDEYGKAQGGVYEFEAGRLGNST